MAKKSSGKSTTKKKTTSKKTTKKTAPKKTTAKKTAAKKPTASKKAPAKKATGKKTAPKPPTIPELLKKDFGEWKPAQLFQSAPMDRSGYSAPPIVDASDPEAAQRIKSLLKKEFDMLPAEREPASVPQRPLPVSESAEPPSMRELLRKDFGTWHPETVYTPPPLAVSDQSAPPFFEPSDEGEAQRLRGLLSKRFDMSPSPEPETAGHVPEPETKGEPEAAQDVPEPPPERDIEPEKAQDVPEPPPETDIEPEKAQDVPEPPPETDIEPEKAQDVPEPPPERDIEPEKAQDVPEPTPEVAPPTEPVSVQELLRRDFGTWQPETVYTAPKPETAGYSAPPFFDATDQGEAQRLKGLLSKRFDMTRSPEPPSEPETAGHVPEPETKGEPEKTQDVPEPPPETDIEPEKAQDVPEPPPETDIEPEKAQDVPEPPPETDIEPEKAQDVPEPPPETDIEPEKAQDVPEPPPERDVEPEKAQDVPEPAPEKTEEAGAEARIRETAQKVVKPAHSAAGGAEESDTREKPAEKVSTTYIPPTETKGSDPMETKMKYLIACFAVVIALLLGASYSNMSKYYIEPQEDGVKILRGEFSPLSREVVAVIPGVKIAEPVKESYGKEEVFPMLYKYYLNQADALLEEAGMPDFDAIRAKLAQAEEFAMTDQQKQAVTYRSNGIDLLVLVYKAGVAMNKGTLFDLEAAKAYLEKAGDMELTDAQTRYVEAKMEEVKSLIAAKAAGVSEETEAAEAEEAEETEAAGEAEEAEGEVEEVIEEAEETVEEAVEAVEESVEGEEELAQEAEETEEAAEVEETAAAETEAEGEDVFATPVLISPKLGEVLAE